MSMETGSSRKKGIVSYSENPFWESTTVKVGKKRITVGGGTHVADSGEYLSHSGIHIVKETDSEEFLKIYTKNVRAIFDLKPTTQRVLQFLMSELQKTPNADAIYLVWMGAEEYFSHENLSVSRPSFQRALKELLDKGFIAESTRPSMFWFNPNLFFNGDRMTFIHEYRRRPIAEPARDPKTVDFIEGKADAEDA